MYLEHLQADGTSSAESLQQLRPKRFLACAREPMLDAEGEWCPCLHWWSSDGSKLSGKNEEWKFSKGSLSISFHSSPVFILESLKFGWLFFRDSWKQKLQVPCLDCRYSEFSRDHPKLVTQRMVFQGVVVQACWILLNRQFWIPCFLKKNLMLSCQFWR